MQDFAGHEFSFVSSIKVYKYLIGSSRALILKIFNYRFGMKSMIIIYRCFFKRPLLDFVVDKINKLLNRYGMIGLYRSEQGNKIDPIFTELSRVYKNICKVCKGRCEVVITAYFN